MVIIQVKLVLKNLNALLVIFENHTYFRDCYTGIFYEKKNLNTLISCWHKTC